VGAAVNGAVFQLPDVRDRSRVEDAADVVIIGSGAAGATAARVLVEAGLDVVIVEEGPQIPTAELCSDMYTTFKRSWRDMGFQVAKGRAYTPVLQGRCVGGTTAINGAIMHRLPAAIHALWQDEYGVTDMLGQAALERAFARLEAELSIAPTPEAVLGENARLLRVGSERLGIGGNRILRNVAGCQGSAHCNQGCPTARRQSMNVSYVPRAVQGGARVYATCRAERLIVRGGRAAGVRGRFFDPLSRERGPRLVLHARHAVVLAASAIQSPLFLADNRIGTGSGVLGERLQAHPGTGVVGLFERPVRLWSGATQGYESTHYWQERMKFETVSMPLELAAARLPGIGPELMRELDEYPQIAIWGVQVRARAHGRVRKGPLGGTAIGYDMTDEDVRTLKLGVRRLVELMFAAGAREVMPGVHGLPDRIRSLDGLARLEALPDDPRLFHCIAAHLFGTAVMGNSSFSSVVGPDLQAHDLPGLYVTDSSVFPTNLGVNPQLSICAVSWIAAERIAERYLATRRGAIARTSASAAGP
jgi:choline dehydrogenase-like flavoprotein